jgi:hypothetical protein
MVDEAAVLFHWSIELGSGGLWGDGIVSEDGCAVGHFEDIPSSVTDLSPEDRARRYTNDVADLLPSIFTA